MEMGIKYWVIELYEYHSYHVIERMELTLYLKLGNYDS